MEDHDWNKRFIELAQFISTWSKDPSSKIGAVIVDRNRRIISTGYNGFARGVSDERSRYDNRELKYRMVLHAEENAILFAKQKLDGCSIYVTVMPPCSHCAALIIQSGIKNVFVPKSPIPERWKDSVELTESMFYEAGVSLNFVDVGCGGPTEAERLAAESEAFSSLSQKERDRINKERVDEVNNTQAGKSAAQIDDESKSERRKDGSLLNPTINENRERMLTVSKLIDYLKTQNPNACIMTYEPNSFGYIEQPPALPNHFICTVAENRGRERKYLMEKWYGGMDDAKTRCEKDLAETYRYCKDDDIVIHG